MFGYVNTLRPELKIREFEYYKSTYCGLCHSLGKYTGCLSRMTLSYDFTFLALVRIAIDGTEVEFGKKRCVAHPFRKNNYMLPNSQLEYCAKTSALLTYHKCCDDLADERGAKRIGAKMLMPYASSARKKAVRELSELDGRIGGYLSELSRIEKENIASADIPAAVFGELLGDIASFGFEGSKKRIAADIGRHVGKWIYLIDALDDYDEDIKKGRYNPFRALYGEGGFDDNARESLRVALTNELVGIENAIDLIDFEDRTDIMGLINNIIYEGLPQTTNKILSCERQRRKND